MFDPVSFLLNGGANLDAALLLNRLSIGLFFVLSGYHKLFNAQRHAAIVAELSRLKVPFLPFNQWWVPSVEFFGGLGFMVGLLAVPAAFGLLVICAVASCLNGPSIVRSYKPLDKADAVDDVLYLPEVIYLVCLLIVVLAGPGAYSLDALLLR